VDVTLCRNPKRSALRVQISQPLIAVPVGPGCPCSGAAAGSFITVLHVQRAGDRDADVYEYPLYNYTDSGDPRFFLDGAVLNYPAVYEATVIGRSAAGYGDQNAICGRFQIIVGPSCGILAPYIAMPGSGGGGGSGGGSGPAIFYPDLDMYPSAFVEPLLT
jgi:hypothetical protein